MSENRRKHLSKLAIVALMLLAGASIACGRTGETVEVTYTYTYTDYSAYRYITGYVFDSWSGMPIRDARITIENDWDNYVWVGWSDYDGYFEIPVGYYYDYEDIYFRAWRITANGYYTYYADDIWYGVGSSIYIDTGDYLLDRYR